MAIDRNLVRTIIGIIGNLISFGFLAIPAPTFYNIIKKRAVHEDFLPDLHLASILDCALWLLYGLPIVHPHNILIATVSGVGLAVELAYVITYFYYANKKQRLYVVLVLAVEVVSYAALVVFILNFPSLQMRTMVAGTFCLIYKFIRWLMLPYDISLHMDYVFCFILLGGFLYGLIWLTYALLRFDLFLTISSVLELLLSLINFIVYAIYRKSTPQRVHSADIENI